MEQEDIPLNYMVLSSSLEMVGVELKCTWAQTRKVNGDIIQKRIADTVNSWKSGKFMEVTSRPWSLNTFDLSKVSFKCHCVDLRVMDITSINSKVKSWLFQDHLEKCRKASIQAMSPINNVKSVKRKHYYIRL